MQTDQRAHQHLTDEHDHGPESARAEAAHGFPPRKGWGQCAECSCGKFEGSGNTCRCGHSFYKHW